MAQGGERLLCNDGALTLDRQHPRGNGRDSCACLQSQTWGTEAGGFLLLTGQKV